MLTFILPVNCLRYVYAWIQSFLKNLVLQEINDFWLSFANKTNPWSSRKKKHSVDHQEYLIFHPQTLNILFGCSSDWHTWFPEERVDGCSGSHQVAGSRVQERKPVSKPSDHPPKIRPHCRLVVTGSKVIRFSHSLMKCNFVIDMVGDLLGLFFFLLIGWSFIFMKAMSKITKMRLYGYQSLKTEKLFHIS